MRKREGAKVLALDVRHGEGDIRRRVALTPAAARAVNRWHRLRFERVGSPPPSDPRAEEPLAALRHARAHRDGTYTRMGEDLTHAALEDLTKRLGRRAEIPEEFRHAHVLRHTFATAFMRRTGDLPLLRNLLGHQDPKTTMIYVEVDEGHVASPAGARGRG